MNVQGELNKIRRQLGMDDDSSACPLCGHDREHVAVTFIDALCGDDEPLGYYYEQDGKRLPYTTDPRRKCPRCGATMGACMILTAVYDAEEWDALQAAPAPTAG